MYVKLFAQILDSSIAENRKLRHFFTDLLLCADCDGRVMMTNHAIARRIGATIEEVEWGLKELQNSDPLSKTVDHDGRRIEAVEGHGYGWRVLNFEFYRALKDHEQLRNETKERVRKHRERKKIEECNADVTHCNKSNDIEIEKQYTNTESYKEEVEQLLTKKAKILGEEEFLATLKASPAYAHINVTVELSKMDTWLMANPGRKKTRRFVANWLNRIEAPLSSNGVKTESIGDSWTNYKKQHETKNLPP